jgi:hypothetical protein
LLSKNGSIFPSIFVMALTDGGQNPQYWNLLSNDDKEIYSRIHSALSAPTSRNKRNKRIDDFREILDAIDLFENTDEYNK